ncbi:MAG: lytic transglycosylase [Micrococcaceae bacterium]|nr:lytic transglycosylase [Micrococcaceae bacterium]
MNSARQPQQGQKSIKQRIAVTTAALPVVMLSSLALAQPAAAQQPHAAPARTMPNQSVLSTGTAGPALSKAVIVPASQLASAVPAALTAMLPAAPAPDSYTVAAGDTVSSIAAQHGLAVQEVLDANGLAAASIIYPGQQISLGGNNSSPSPAAAATDGSSSSYTVQPGDTISSIAAAHDLGVGEVLQLNGLSNTSVIYPGQAISLGGPAAVTATAVVQLSQAPGGSYTIQPGDTLTSIAAGAGVSVGDLLSANNLSANSVIFAGKELTLPGAGAAAAAAPAPTDLVPSTFLHYTYPEAVVAEANVNKAALLAAPVPSRGQMQDIIVATAQQMGVDPTLALGFAMQESGFDQQAVSPANAIGTMQVIPQSGEWASELVGRHLNLLDPQDNVTAGVAIIRVLVSTSPSVDEAIAGYYQGQYSVSQNGMFPDTQAYVASVRAYQASFS